MKKLNLLLMIMLFAGYTPYILASQTQSTVSIQATVRHFVASNLALNTDYKLKTGKLDPRLKLPLCVEPLQAFIRTGSLKPGRNSIGVKCNDTKKWTIYTSVNISVYRKVMVLSQPIRRGEIFNSTNIKQEKRDISSLRSGFLTDPSMIINKQATRNLSLGYVINKSNFTEPKLIRRGEKVYIYVNSPSLSISMAGIAMMDGIKGQNIRVKNIKSRQIVQATVSQPGQVVVNF